MIYYNIKQVFRGLMRNASYSVLSIFSFAIGLAVCIMIVMHIYNQFTYDYCFENHNRIYKIIDDKHQTCNIDYNLSAYLIEAFPEVEVACPIQIIDEPIKIKTSTNFARFYGMASTNNDFFEVFSINVLQKMGHQAFLDDNSVVITQSLANTLFGDSDPIGEMVVVDDDMASVVTAVIEDLPSTSSLQANIFINSTDEEWKLYQSCQHNTCIYRYAQFILFKENMDIDEFTEKLNASISSHFPTIGKIRVLELTSIYLSKPTENSVNRHGSLGILFLFMAMGSLVLIISTINYLNFTISQKLSALKEIGVRRIAGAKTKELMAYSFTQVLVYLLFSLTLSYIIASQLLSIVNATMSVKLSANLLFDPVFMGIIALVLLPVILFSATIPILFLPRIPVIEYLRNRKGIMRKFPLRSILTITQLTVSIFLFAVVIVVARQIYYVKTTELGFDKMQLLSIVLPYNFEQSLAFKQRVEQTTIHSGVSLSRGTPGLINYSFSDAVESIPFQTQVIYVDYDFVNTMGIELLKGRDFISEEKGKRCIINRELLKKSQWISIENQFLWKNSEGGFEVIGVVENFHTASLNTKVEPVCLIIANSDELKERWGVEMNTLFNVNIRLTPGNIASKIEQLQSVWSEFMPDEPMDYFFFDSFFDSFYREEETLGKSLGVISLIAILLTCFGLLGQIMHDSLARTKEIGIRKVNGAKIWEVMVLLNKNLMKWVGIAFVIATPIAWYAMDKWLQNFAYRATLSWWVFALAGLLVLFIALLTVSWQSWRAASRNPVEALRYE